MAKCTRFTCAATRKALAVIVEVGFKPPLEGKNEVSTGFVRHRSQYQAAGEEPLLDRAHRPAHQAQRRAPPGGDSSIRATRVNC